MKVARNRLLTKKFVRQEMLHLDDIINKLVKNDQLYCPICILSIGIYNPYIHKKTLIQHVLKNHPDEI